MFISPLQVHFVALYSLTVLIWNPSIGVPRIYFDILSWGVSNLDGKIERDESAFFL